jgi:hypothetical protein
VTKQQQVVTAILAGYAEDRWLTTAELCERFGVHRRTVDKAREALRASNALPAKGEMHRCRFCDERAIARRMCKRHYGIARMRGMLRKEAA